MVRALCSQITEDGEPLTARQIAQERRTLLMKLFADTGTCKIPAIVKYVKALLADELSGKVSAGNFKYCRAILAQCIVQCCARACSRT
jgi:hypothetical protein